MPKYVLHNKLTHRFVSLVIFLVLGAPLAAHAAAYDYNVAPEGTIRVTRSVAGAPMVSGTTVLPLPHLSVTIRQRTATKVKLNVSPRSNAIPGTIYTVRLKRPGPDPKFKVLVLRKGQITNGQIQVVSGFVRQVTIRGSGFGTRVKVKFSSNCKGLHHGPTQHTISQQMGHYFNAYNVIQNRVTFWVRNETNINRSCRIIMRDHRSTQVVGNASDFTGDYRVVASTVTLPSPGMPDITAPTGNSNVIQIFSSQVTLEWDKGNGPDPDLYRCWCTRLTGKLPGESFNLGTCSARRDRQNKVIYHPQTSCKFRGLKSQVTYRLSVLAEIKQGSPGSLRAGSPHATVMVQR